MVGYFTVVEVLRDEVPKLRLGKGEGRGGFGWREQRWCAVEVRDDGVGLKEAFGMGMERRGIGRGIEKGSTETEVGNVAKVWGFGGRRV